MIHVSNLHKTFGTTSALRDVSFEVARGEIVGLLGPNGAGKSTMMRVLTGYLPPTSGTARIGGLDVQEHPIEVRRRIGYLPETPPVYTELTVSSYLGFIADLRELPRAAIKDRIAAVMAQVGVTAVSHRVIGHLSKGYRQRVGLAQALLHDPELLILDEPTVGLDPKQVVEIRAVIRELAARHTVILSSHILPEVSQICSRIIIIDRGRIVAINTQAELERSLKGTQSLFVAMRGPEADVAAALRGLTGVASVSLRTPASEERPEVGYSVESERGKDLREDLFHLAASRRWPIVEMRPEAMSLEEVFLQLTTREGALQP